MYGESRWRLCPHVREASFHVDFRSAVVSAATESFIMLLSVILDIDGYHFDLPLLANDI